MTQNSRQVKKVAARPKVRHGKRVPEHMERTAYPFYTQVLECELEITQKVPGADFIASASAKERILMALGQVPVEKLSQLNAHWYEAMFVALSFDPKDEVVKVHIWARQSLQLLTRRPVSRAVSAANAHTGLVTPDGLPVYKQGHLRRRKRR